MSGKSVEDYEADYTEPELRARLKEEIKAGDRGGRPGRWSARKSQLLVTQYEAHGGGYTRDGERTASQQHLRDWTDQDWRTSDGGAHGSAPGSADARDGEGTPARYLPDAAWRLMTPGEQRDADRSKTEGEGQHVPNTAAARESRAAAELLELPAREAVRRVAGMHGDHQLDRARRAEEELGAARKTVLRRIEAQREDG